MKKPLFLALGLLFVTTACKKECPQQKPLTCPKVAQAKCPTCKPCPKPTPAKAPKANPDKKYQSPKGKRAEHLPVTLPCINRSVLKFVDKKVIRPEQSKKFGKLHQVMHDKGMEALETKIYTLQKKMALAVAQDTWKEAEIKKQLLQMSQWQLEAYMLKAKLVRDLHKILDDKQRKVYVKELVRRINNIYKRAMEH